MKDDRVCLSRWIAWRARQQRDRAALVTPFASRSFSELHTRANKLANRFIAAGLQPGETVLLLCGSRPEFAEAMIAGERTGLSMVPLVYDLKPPELRPIIADAAAQALIVDASLDHSIGAISGECTAMKLRLALAGVLDGFESYEHTIANVSAAAPPVRPRGFPIYFTSGTTGRPKGVIRRRPDLSPLATALPRLYAFRDEGDAVLCPFPLFQPGVFNAAVATPLAAGVTVYLTAASDAAAVIETIAREKITHAHLSPYLLHLMGEMGEARLAEYDLSALRCIVHGGAACPVELKRWAIRQFGPVIVEYYAATEGGGLSITAAEWLRKPGSVGKPPPELGVMITDEDGHASPTGTAGLIHFRAAPDDRFEYLGDAAKTRAAYRGDHFTVEDMGYLDDDGYLFLVGRSADIANINEDNVYPEEIDQTLAAHPAVAEALTFSVPQTGKGETLVSLVLPRVRDDAGECLRRQLIEHCRQNLARYKWPEIIEFAEALPRSAAGKKHRQLARQQFLDRTASSP